MKKLLTLFLVLILFTSCGEKQKTQEKPQEEEKTVPPVIEEIEMEIISIMEKADLIPYYEKQIAEKKRKEMEKLQLLIMAFESLNQNSSNTDSGNNDQGQGQGNLKEIDKLVKFIPAPITISDILLTEIIKNDKGNKKEEKDENQEIPDDIIFIWHEINTKIKNLHQKWNTLESELNKVGNTKIDKIEGFEKALNNLTIQGIGKDYINTLIYSNQLTSFIPEFLEPFKKEFPLSIYHMKYYLRQIIIDCGNNNYQKALENLNQLKSYRDITIPQLSEKKMTEEISKLNSSIIDFEESVKLQDINIIKIKGSIVMKNINNIKDNYKK